MTPPKMIAFIFCGIFFVWIVMQVVILKSCMHVKSYVPTNIQALCQKEQKYILLRIYEVTKDDAKCQKLIENVEYAVAAHGDIPIIYVITPTYERPVQKAELTRLSHTLMLLPHVHWIIVEDAENKTALVKNFLIRSTISFTHLHVATPLPVKMRKEDPSWLKPKGVLQRNFALSWMRDHIDPNTKGVVYFADDDNTYDLKLFDEMRYTQKVSVWPVGLVGGLLVERPIVKNGKVVGWNTVWKADRPFPIDMAGFAVNLALLLKHREAGFSLSVPRGYQESKLLKDLVTISELEPKADNCSKVLVWHMRTEYPKLKQERKLKVPSNWNIEV